MGYSYEAYSGRLCCDKCGNSGGVRKRTCPYKVTGDSLRSPDGQRGAGIPYCYPAALCATCYSQEKHTLHADCPAGAARSQAEADAIEAGLDAGELYVVSASMVDGHPGLVRVTFWGRRPGNGQPRPEATRVMPGDMYDFRARPRLSDYDSEPAVVAA